MPKRSRCEFLTEVREGRLIAKVLQCRKSATTSRPGRRFGKDGKIVTRDIPYCEECARKHDKGRDPARDLQARAEMEFSK